jgi:hypothetical protein
MKRQITMYRSTYLKFFDMLKYLKIMWVCGYNIMKMIVFLEAALCLIASLP